MENDTLQKEKEYLAQTLDFIRAELARENENLRRRKEGLAEANRDMYENSAHHSNDFDKLSEISQHLAVITSQTAAFGHTHKHVEKLERMLAAPYFGRFDFSESGNLDSEKIYIGLGTLMDPDTFDIYVYDWRSPIAGIYYRFEPGPAFYESPDGRIDGTVTLKRQYRIRKAELESYFDCSIQIRDEILQEVLSRNASPQMRNIVETIQREQDQIIRDTDSDLLLVQGVAGSGKTSIALHRIAYLLYEGLSAKLLPENILILSPNAVFDRYIARVLPGLGEEAVVQTTLEMLFREFLGAALPEDARLRQMESVLDRSRGPLRARSTAFKGSATFRILLDRLLSHTERKLVQFQDVCANRKLLFHRTDLKNEFLHNPTQAPMARRLSRIEGRILERLKPYRNRQLRILTDLVERNGNHPFDYKSYGKLLGRKVSKRFHESLKTQTTLSPAALYRRLMTDRSLFLLLSKGLELPDDWETILADTAESLASDTLLFEDAGPLVYLKLKIEGFDVTTRIRQVVVDEAQDYEPLHYEIMRQLYPNARFTIVGDIAQTIAREQSGDLYDQIAAIFNRSGTHRVSLNTSYRTSCEISRFSDRLAYREDSSVPIDRHGNEPRWIQSKSFEAMTHALVQDLTDFQTEGFASAAVITRTRREARRIATALSSQIAVNLVDDNDNEITAGITILPTYLAKGLEFDVALVVGADASGYQTEADRRLLYVGCTRGLHRLNLYGIGAPGPIIGPLFES